MTETPFKAYKADVAFETVAGEGESLIASAEANQNKHLESIHKRNADLFKYELDAAKVKDSRLSKLAELSQTAATVMGPIIQARTNEELVKGAKLYKDGLAKNQADRQAEYERDEQQQLTEELINNEIIDEADKKGEIDPWLKDKLKKIPRLQKIGYQKALYAQEAKMYPLYREQNKSVPVRIQDSNGQWVDRALEDAKDPNEWHQINDRLVQGYIRPFATHDQPMVEKYLYKEMRNIEDIDETKWTTARLNKITADDNLKADNSLKNNFVSNPNALMEYALKEQSRHGSISKARTAGVELIKKDIELGLINSDDIEALKKSIYSDKTTKTDHLFGDRFPRDMIALEDALYERDKKDHDKKTTKENIDFKNDEDDIHAKFNKKWDDGEEVKDKEVEKEQDRFVKTYGKRSNVLDAIKQDLTIEAKTLDKLTAKANALADLGLLTNDRLAEFPWQIQRKLNDVAQLQTTANTGGQLYIDAIADLLKVNATTLPDGTRDPSVRIMTNRMQKLYRTTLLDALENDVENPYEYAYSKVDKYIREKVISSEGKTNRGYKLDLPKADQLTTSSIQINQRRQETNSWITQGAQSLDEQDTFFSAVEISNALKGYGKPGWRPHPRAVYIADQFQIDPLAVLQRQAKAYDPKADLQDVPSIKAFNDKVSKYNKQLILNPRNSANYDGVSRAWGTTGEVNYSIFKNEEQAKQLGDELGIPDYAVEAAVELGLLGRVEPLDEEEQLNYFKAVYKMSGGTDKRALEQLMRPTFKP